MEFKAYQKIGQLRDLVKGVQRQADFKGLDDEGNAIYEESVKPVITFKGTVKIHGTNAGITYSPSEGLLAQKRTSLLSEEDLSSHFGFNQFVQVEKLAYFTKIMKDLWDKYCVDGEQFVIYGEWAGYGIQKAVAVSELPKALYVFDAGILRADGAFDWVQNVILPQEPKVYNIDDFQTFWLDIDFNSPQRAVDTLIAITEEVERECPVGKHFGVSGIGEGVVWTAFYQGQKLVMKVKGEKHAVSKVTKLTSVDVEKIESIEKFAKYACTRNRVLQAMAETNATDRKDTPNIMKWIANDIIKEETDTLLENGLEWKQVAKQVSSLARDFFFAEIDKF